MSCRVYCEFGAVSAEERGGGLGVLRLGLRGWGDLGKDVAPMLGLHGRGHGLTWGSIWRSETRRMGGQAQRPRVFKYMHSGGINCCCCRLQRSHGFVEQKWYIFSKALRFFLFKSTEMLLFKRMEMLLTSFHDMSAEVYNPLWFFART